MRRYLLLLLSIWIAVGVFVAPLAEARAAATACPLAATSIAAPSTAAMLAHRHHADPATASVPDTTKVGHSTAPHPTPPLACCSAACLCALPAQLFHGLAPTTTAAAAASPVTTDRLPTGTATRPLLEPPIRRV